MPQAQVTGSADQEFVVAPSGGLKCGDIVQCASGRAGVVEGLRPVAEGEYATANCRVRSDVTSASGTTFSAGAVVGWDDTNKVAVASADGDFDLGKAARAKTSGQTVVSVIFNIQ